MVLRLTAVPGREAGVIDGNEVKGLGAQCPNCSKVYDEYDYDKPEPLEFPDTCKRCGSPMECEDVNGRIVPGKAAREFADARARDEQVIWPEREPESKTFDGVDFEVMAQLLQSQGYSVKKTKHVGTGAGQSDA